MKNVKIIYSGICDQKAMKKYSKIIASEIKEDEMSERPSWVGLANNCGVKANNSEQFLKFAENAIKNYLKLSEIVSTRNVLSYEAYMQDILGINFLRNLTVQIGFNHGNIKNLKSFESSTLAACYPDDDMIGVFPYTSIVDYGHERTHHELMASKHDKEHREFVYYFKRPGDKKKHRISDKIERICTKKDNMLKLHTIDEGLSYCFQNEFLARKEKNAVRKPEDYASNYTNRYEKRKDFNKPHEIFTRILRKYPFMEIMKMTKETLDESYETYENSVEILERKAKEHDEMIFDINEIHKNRENYLDKCSKDPVLSRFLYLM